MSVTVTTDTSALTIWSFARFRPKGQEPQASGGYHVERKASLATSLGVTVGTLATQISSQATADTGMNAQTKDLLNKIATAIQATSPSSSIRNSLYSA